MEIISKPEEWAVNLYKDTIFNNKFKLSDYCIVTEYDDGYLLFHTITWTFLFLTKEEYKYIEHNTFMFENKIIVNDDFDESEIAETAYIKRSYVDIKNKYSAINSFVVFTTNECNANCPYCYETIKKGHMTKDVADDFIKFVEKKHTKPISISWFGGEPMVNCDIIDYIVQSLIDRNIPYTTSMISNFLKFTPDYLEKAVKFWHLNDVQVTIDGPEEYYNKTKNFDYDGNAFRTVIDNIRNTIDKTNIKIVIRINVSDENIDMIDDLMTFLQNEFKDAIGTRISVDIHEVFQVADGNDMEKLKDFYIKLYELQKKYVTAKKQNMIIKRKLTHCFSDLCSCAVITPNGLIHNCEHTGTNNVIGTLKKGIIYNDILLKASEKGDENNRTCKQFNCKLLPVCDHYKFCNDSNPCKTKEFSDIKNELFIRKLINTYEYYKEQKKKRAMN